MIKFIKGIFNSVNGLVRLPLLTKNRESNIQGLFIVGDLAGSPVIKLAMEQGHKIIDHISALLTKKQRDRKDIKDVLIIGSGAAGLNAAFAANEKNLSTIVLEKNKIANTIEDFPGAKWIYAEPDSHPVHGSLFLEETTKEKLLEKWHQQIKEKKLDIKTGEEVTGISKENGVFHISTPGGTYKAFFVVLAIGQRGNPRKLQVKGEEAKHIYHMLYSPRKYHDEDILVVGGGNSAVEAAVTLSEQNRVVLSYRKSEFSRLFKDNALKLKEAVSSGKIKVIFNSNVKEFSNDNALLNVDDNKNRTEVRVGFQHAFILIGAELPVKFLKSFGIILENEWAGSLLRGTLLLAAAFVGLWFAGGKSGIIPVGLIPLFQGIGTGVFSISAAVLLFFTIKGDRFAWLSVFALIWYTVYGVKIGSGVEFWPFQNWGYKFFSFGGRPWSFWYTVIYTALMTIFGFSALKRWGIDRKNKYQIKRYISLIGFQWIFFFIIPEFIFQLSIKYQWLGALAKDPVFAEQGWRTYGIFYAWPLFFNTFLNNPHLIWVVWGVVLTFVLIPVFVIFHGKRYCSWICGCGGLAETFGDRWRHLAPKGRTAIKWEAMGMGILVFAVITTILMLLKDVLGALSDTALALNGVYLKMVDLWMIGIIPVALYPFMGSKIWCRFWCPLAKFMQILSKFFVRIRISRFHIYSNDKCIGCYECTRNCLVGIDVMSYALKQEVLDNETSSCIGCGICVAVCPMKTLGFKKPSGESVAQ